MSGIDEMMRRISDSFNQQSAMATLGVVLEQIEKGQVTLKSFLCSAYSPAAGLYPWWRDMQCAG